MAFCSSYKSTVAESSPFSPLVKKIDQDKVEKSKLDNGFYQIDYYKPGKEGYYKGAGDCSNDEFEYAEYGANNWQKYRDELRNMTGKRLSWDYSPDAVKPDSSEYSDWVKNYADLDERLGDVIKIIKKELAKNGIPEGSDEYKTKMADGFFMWLEFPSIKTWKKFDKGQQSAIAKKIPLHGDPFFKPLELHLSNKGGFENVFSKIRTTGLSGTLRIGPQFQFDSNTFLLFHALRTANLNPRFFEVTIADKATFTCSESSFTGLGIGIPLSNRNKILFVQNHSMELPANTVVYPMSLRQVFFSRDNFQEVMDMLITKTADGPKNYPLGDGIAQLFKLFMTDLLPFIENVETKDKKTPAEGNAKLSALQNREAHHPFMLFFLAITSMASEQKLTDKEKKNFLDNLFNVMEKHPATPPHIVDLWKLVYVAVLPDSLSAADKKKSLEAARRTLKLDANCTWALNAIIKETDFADTSVDLDPYFEKLLQIFDRDSESYPKIYATWGNYKVERGELPQAEALYRAATRCKNVDSDTIVMTHLKLASVYFKLGDKGKTLETISKASELFVGRVRNLDKKAVEECNDTLKKWKDSKIFSKEMLKDPQVRLQYVNMHFYEALPLIRYKKYEDAKSLLEDIKDDILETDKAEWLLAMHELHLQMKNVKEAQQIFKSYEQTFFK